LNRQNKENKSNPLPAKTIKTIAADRKNNNMPFITVKTMDVYTLMLKDYFRTVSLIYYIYSKKKMP
jgi:hypothetical protein